MNLLLFETGGGALYPVVEQPAPLEQASVPQPGKWRTIKRKVRQTYQELKAKLDYQEGLCSQLRRAGRVTVYHSPRMDSAQAQEKLREFFRHRSSKHARWLWIDSVLAFLGIFMMPVPGPNIFFFYPAARSLGHYLARKGALHALGLELLSSHPEPLIDEVQQRLGNLEQARDLLAELEGKYNLRDLETILSRLKGL